MKSNLFFSTLLSFSFLFISCKNEEEAEVTTSDAPKEIIIPDVQATTRQNFGQQPTTQNVAVNPGQMVTQAQTIAPTQTQVAVKPGMNPPHGQPGHRCDIPVGASLSTPVKAQPKPVGGATITQQTLPTSQNNVPLPAFTTTDAPSSTTPVVTAPGMNPPHGQAGHVCSVAVGAPLPKTSDSQ